VWRSRHDAIDALLTENSKYPSLLNSTAAKSCEVCVAGATHTLFVPPNFDPKNDKRLILHLHGGGYVQGSPQCEAPIATPIAAAVGCPVLAIRYPLWSEALPPADVDRVIAVFLELIKDRESHSIALMGTSAGGGLALRTALGLAKLKVPMPASIVLAAPWADLSGGGDTFSTLMPLDVVEPTIIGNIRRLIGASTSLRSPELSPVYAVFPSNFPPTIVAAGTRDSLLSDCVRLQRKLTDVGVQNDRRLFEGMPHGFMYFRTPETSAFVKDFASFIDSHIKK